MLPDLERLIQLQQLENTAAKAREAIDRVPNQLVAFEVRMTERTDLLAGVQQRLTDHRSARQEVEKDLAARQSRLSRCKEQLMEVKTNKEYHAKQAEITGAESEVQELEDRLLEQLLDGDELAAAVKDAEQAVATERTVVAEERTALEQQRQQFEQQLQNCTEKRAKLARKLPPQIRSLFETVASQRKGIAVVEALNGRCTSCQVRLRPQLFNNIRLNKTLIQCESCHRFLYFRLETGITAQS